MDLKRKRLFLLDLDGTLYLGSRLFEHTAEFLKYLKESGRKYYFFTNNSSRNAGSYVEKLKKMGIDSDVGDFITSMQATAEYLYKKYENRPLYVFGTRSFKYALIQRGLNVSENISGDICCLVMGFDTELTFEKLENACRLLNRGTDFVATNPDLLCPTEYGNVPDCGSFAQILHTATGRKPVVIGKPEPAMVEMALKASGYTPEETVLIGDRLYTDIQCAVNSGIDSVLVLSGETRFEDIKASEIKPTAVLSDIKQVLERLILNTIIKADKIERCFF